MTLLMYLAKVFICSGILFGYYRLFLRNKLFHRYNRFYLLAALFTSILLPFIKIPVFYQPGNAVNEAVYQTVDVLTVNHWEEEVQPVANTSFSRFLTPENGAYLLYAAVIIVLLVVVLKSLLYIRKIRKEYPGEAIDHLKFYNTREPGTPFSFFRSVFWNDQLPFNSREGQQIFRHELFHVQQKHSADILLAEIITAVFWYNPFFYLMKKEVKAIHEFLADQYAASGNDRYAYAELLVQQTLAAKKQALTNHFFQSHIKRRIAMITQFQKSNYGYWSRVMILPVSLLLFCAFSLYTHKPVEKLPTLSLTPMETITVVIDPAHGGIDNGAVSEQLKEKDIALQISRQIEQLAPEYKVKVILTRTGDYLPGNANDISQGLKNRTNIVSQTNSSLFVSIHVSSDREPHTGSGFEVFVTNKNEKQVGASTKLGMSLINSISNLYTTKPTLLQRKEQNIWVLDQATCPAVLIECGYITNSKDAAFVTDAGNQKLIAQKILEGIVAYRNSSPQMAQLNSDNTTEAMNKTGGDAATGFKLKQVKDIFDTIPKRSTGSWQDTLPRRFDKDATIVMDTVELKLDHKVETKVDTKVDIKFYKDVQKLIEKTHKNEKKFDNNKQVIADTINVIMDTIPKKTTSNIKLSKPMLGYILNDSFKLAYMTNITLLQKLVFKPNTFIKVIPNSKIIKYRYKTGQPMKLDIKPFIKMDLKNIDSLRNNQQKPVSLLGTEAEALVRS
jgi:N-acetylmuramoyl-L-alanine amidase